MERKIRGRCYFYSRPCGRGDTTYIPYDILFTDFYSRPCERGDLLQALGVNGNRNISTHAPARGATKPESCREVACCDFYSRPCERGDVPASYIPAADMISTHAPARGATPPQHPEARSLHISTHAPAGGATAILHKTGIGSGFKLQKTHIVFDPDFSNSCVNPQKAVQIIGIVCANLPQNSV